MSVAVSLCAQCSDSFAISAKTAAHLASGFEQRRRMSVALERRSTSYALAGDFLFLVSAEAPHSLAAAYERRDKRGIAVAVEATW